MSKVSPCITPFVTRRRFLHIASLGCLTLLGTVSLATQSKLPQTEKEQASQSPASDSPVTLNGWMLREGDI